MKRRELAPCVLALLAAASIGLASGPVFAKNSKGGTYVGGKGSSHKGGTYASPKGKRYNK